MLLNLSCIVRCSLGDSQTSQCAGMTPGQLDEYLWRWDTGIGRLKRSQILRGSLGRGKEGGDDRASSLLLVLKFGCTLGIFSKSPMSRCHPQGDCCAWCGKQPASAPGFVKLTVSVMGRVSESRLHLILPQPLTQSILPWGKNPLSREDEKSNLSGT